MSAAIITQLIIAIGPVALDLIPKLAALWSAPSLTLEQVVGLCEPAKKSYDDYIAAARAAVASAGSPIATPPIGGWPLVEPPVAPPAV